MKALLAAILFSVAALHAAAQDLTIKIRAEAERCAKALLDADYKTVAALTHKRAIDLMGGEQAMIETVKKGMAQMRADNFVFERAIIGAPSNPKPVGGWLVSTVPQEIVIKIPTGRLHQDGHLLGISEDDGKTWVFIDLGPITPELFAKVFPELKDKVSLPAKTKPVLRKQ
jgi:hypothetical protein